VDAGPTAGGLAVLPAIDPNGPSIFTAVQEQLGLKLDSTKGPLDVLVIEHVEQSTGHLASFAVSTSPVRLQRSRPLHAPMQEHRRIRHPRPPLS
jgi:hypothetical protein